MRMNPPRGMGGMGPQVSNTKSSTKDCVDNVVTVYGVYCAPTVQLPQTDLVLGAVIFLKKANFWLPFIKSVHKNSHNVKPTGYKLHANNLSSFLKRSFFLVAPAS